MTQLINFKRITKAVGISDQGFRNNVFLHRLLPSFAFWSPVAFSIAITSYCNFKCKMCVRTTYGLENMHMEKEIFVKASKYFANKTVNIVGPGEPFLHPDLFDFIKICELQNTGLHIVTNGSLLSSGITKTLLQHSNLQSLAFSIDGVADTYNQIRVNGNFEKTVNNLKTVSLLRSGSFPKIIVNFVGMRSNIDDLPVLVKILGNYVDSIQVIHPLCLSQEMADDHLNNYVQYAKGIFETSMKISTKAKLVLPSLNLRSKGCIYPWVLPYIGIKGNVYPCHMFGGNDLGKPVVEFYGKESTICDSANSMLGNIGDFDRIWNGNKLVQFRKELAEINISDMGNCNYGKNSKSYHSHCMLCPNRWDVAC